jgi:hypothetical protein
MAKDSLFGNIFDVDADVQSSREKSALSLAALSPGRVQVAGSGMAGSMLGGGVMEGLGYQNPEQQKQQAIAEVWQEVGKLDLDDAANRKIVGNAFIAKGLYDIGMDILQYDDKTTTTARKTVKGADGYTYYADTQERVLPGVVAKSTDGGRKTIKGADGFQYYADTQERVLPGVEGKAEVRDTFKGADGYQYYSDTKERVLPDVVIKEDPAPYESSYSKKIGDLTGEEDVNTIKGAKKAIDAVVKHNKVIKLIQEGKPQLGFASTFRADIDRALSLVGLSKESVKSATDTQILTALLGSDVFPMISQLGIGARGLDTVKEREFLIEVMTGSTKMEGEALLYMTQLRQKYAVEQIERYNAALANGDFDLYQSTSRKKLSKLEIPELEKIRTPRPEGAIELRNKETGEIEVKYPDGHFYTKDGILLR